MNELLTFAVQAHGGFARRNRLRGDRLQRAMNFIGNDRHFVKVFNNKGAIT